MLLSKGYPDIGWNPCGGEKYLDFLRFAVFVNGLDFICYSMEYLIPIHLFLVIPDGKVGFFYPSRRERGRECERGGPSPHS